MSILKKDKTKKIPVKNYIYLSIIVIASIFIIFYLYRWYDTYRESKLNISIMNNYLSVINYNVSLMTNSRFYDYIIENKNAIIYVSKLGDEKINKFEKSFKNMVIENDLRNSMLYLDVTNDNFDVVKEKLQINTSLPCIVVYTNGKITDVYSITNNNYDMKKLNKYLNRIGATDID